MQLKPIERFLYIILLFLNVLNFANAQNPKIKSDTAIVKTDSLRTTVRDTVVLDSVDNSSIKAPINYSANDSMMLSMTNQKIYLYGSANIKTEGTELTAEYVEIDMSKNELFAEGRKDKNGEYIGSPVFKDGGEEFDAKSMIYNIKTKKGIVYEVVSELSGGYLHGQKTKIYPNKEVHILDGKFTTCDLKHPHFYIELTKAKVIPNKKIVSGPFYFVIADVPLPIGLPFGIFPIQKGNTSGVLIPSYGEEKRRGFYLRDFGYYFAISDNFDVAVQADVYTYGSWGARLTSRYKRLYRYDGRLNIKYDNIVEGNEGVSDYSKNNSFWVDASYAQDPKANPTSNFNATLSFGKSNFMQYNAESINDYVQSQAMSSISFRKQFRGTPFNLSANATANQNLQTKDLTLSLPTIAFNMSRQFPFKRKKPIGKPKWYEKIGISYTSSFRNTLNTKDSLLFRNESLEQMKYGFQHSIPISTSFKLLKHFSLSPSFTFNGKVYPNYINKRIVDNFNGSTGNIEQNVVTDTISGLKYMYDFQFSVPFTTKLYGMFNFKKGKIKAFRHVMTPSVSFNYRPDFSEQKWSFYKGEPLDTLYNRKYSISSNGIFGSPPSGKYGSIGFSLGNNFEMKVASRDTSKESSKIKLLESLNLNTSYNLAADSLKWSNLTISGGTRLFKSITVNFNSTFDPYTVDSNGVKINTFERSKNNRLVRFVSSNFSVGASFNSEQFKKKDEEKSEKIGKYNYFSIPWTLSVNYTLNYNKATFDKINQQFEKNITQTLNFNGSLQLTPKWRIQINSGYDFKTKELTATSITINRDLHCWEMSLYVIPFGTLQSYNFRINIRSPLFKDIKYTKDKRWQDNF